ncbi:S-layer homology domain-containing protein [Candidatus Villigracilis affinis]|uniref:S-layer homology domain-containing protein n=1 Tax=Candidatus Villigracilis affinis TaxID=3140682 RepID=UPI002A1970C7|nr:S-layer homology domain-containing protein [Anaerolineales bacterium]
MSKKVFTVLLLAVFVLAQFSIASAAPVAGAEGTLVGPDFMPAGATSTVDFDWTATGLTNPTNIVMYARIQGGTYAVDECNLVATINGTSTGSGTFTYDFSVSANAATPADGDYWEFTLVFDSTDTCGVSAPANPAVADNFLASSYVDGTALEGILAIPHPDFTAAGDVACNTFEYWALASDSFGLAVPTDPYSGFGSWNAQTTGTFAPAPIGAEDELLEWQITLPATASGLWQISIDPEDAAGNLTGAGPYYFRNGAVSADEVEDCVDFTDVAGHENEVHIRYLADLGLISGFADGSFGPDNTLTRAEAATLIEISNGYDTTTLPTSAPAGCDFTDVAASDWFAGWVWQACDDGFMNGVGGGLFDPNNLLTRGQIVTIFNNIYENGLANLLPGSHMSAGFGLIAFSDASPEFRTAAWTDVSLGAYYAEPVVEAYSWGIVDGTSETTFSPDQAMTRGEFAKTLYRILASYGGF